MNYSHTTVLKVIVSARREVLRTSPTDKFPNQFQMFSQKQSQINNLGRTQLNSFHNHSLQLPLITLHQRSHMQKPS